MRRVAVVTVGRSDYGYYRSILRAMRAHGGLKPLLVVGGAHLVPAWGDTIAAIERDGEEVAARVHMSLAADSPGAVGMAMGLGLAGFAAAYERLVPDWVLLLGDRYEMLAAAAATLPFNLAVAHIAGGEVTLGAIDDLARHAITKLSHVHFVATEEYRQRVIQMGEAPERVIVSGAPSLDAALAEPPVSRESLEQRFGIRLDPAPLLVTQHPVTRRPGETEREIDELLAALEAAGQPVVFTYPNADAESSVIIERITAYVGRHADAWLVPSFGAVNYYSMMRHASAMVGNSSSGIIEAASFGLPVVNVGERQAGRLRPGNVIDVACERGAVRAAIERATTPGFRDASRRAGNPYGSGDAAPRIVRALAALEPGPALLAKPFVDLTVRP